jgi:hypothetical protein
MYRTPGGNPGGLSLSTRMLKTFRLFVMIISLGLYAKVKVEGDGNVS